MTCPLLFTGLEVNTIGRARPCCEFEGYATDAGRELNAIDDGFTGLFHSEFFTDLRNQARAGQTPTGCARCVKHEQMGFISRRQREISRLGNPTQPVLRVLDMKLGNTCNLSCIICNAWSSSKVMVEEIKLGYQTRPEAWLARDFKWPNHDRFWTELSTDMEGIQFIDIMGGEPMLAIQHKSLLERIITHGNPKGTYINYVTNGTIWDDAITEMFDKFGHVHITLSADGIGDTYEYCRYPGRWTTYEENLHKYRALGCSVTVCYSVSAFSLFGVFDALEFYHDLGVEVWLNLVNNLDRSIQVLPSEMKAAFTQMVEDRFDPEWNKIMPSSNIDAILNYMNDTTAGWDEFKARTSRIDAHRNNSLLLIAPMYEEFWR